jgi:hypothetical protein
MHQFGAAKIAGTKPAKITALPAKIAAPFHK